jgi:hypothetical protein
MSKVSSKVTPLSYTDGGSARDLIIIQRAIPSDYSFSDVRNALKDIEGKWTNHHYLPKVYGAFDCDGSVSTTYSKSISRKIVSDVEGYLIEVIIEHHTQANI